MKAHKVTKPLKGHFDKADVAPKRTLRELRVENIDSYNVGDLIKADVFANGDKVDVTGVSKGKGCLLYTSRSVRTGYRRSASAGRHPFLQKRGWHCFALKPEVDRR